MTDLEKAQERVRIATEALEFVKTAANHDRKLSHDKHMNGHYHKALDELNRVVETELAMLKRVETIGH